VRWKASIKFDTVFRNKRAVVETVTLMLEDDGAWRASAYLIQ